MRRSHSQIGWQNLQFLLRALVCWALFVLHSPLSASVVVNSPLPVTHEVRVQPIITGKSDGTTAAFMGDASSEAYIKAEIDRVWAQSGVMITWAAPAELIDDFSYDGSPNDYSSTSRPQSDLRKINDDAPSPPKHADATVINMYFVEIVPGFQKLGDNYANGLATLDRNRCAIHVGANLLGWSGGRDVVASVISHEIGHNLGLSHTGSGQPNLMSPGGTTEQLDSDQTTRIFEDSWGIDSYEMLRGIPTESNYTRWAALHGVEGTPQGDDDGDRITNVIEFMIGLDPTTPSLLPPPIRDSDGLRWTLPKVAGAIEDGLTYVIELSDDGHNWFPAGTSSISHTMITDDNSELSVRLSLDQPRGFMRFSTMVPETLAPVARTVSPWKSAIEPGTSKRAGFSGCAHGTCGCKTARREVKK